MYLTLAFESHEAYASERPAQRWQLGDPGHPDTGVPPDDPAHCPSSGRGDRATPIAESRAEQRTEIAAVRTEIAGLETRLIRWMVGTVLATGALTVAILRLVG